jgi:methyl-accepting chemotaxis protein
MNYIEQLDKAIGAHGMWKSRLRMAIDSGSSDFTPAIVKTDNNCEFGKWLHNEISPELKKTPIYGTVVKMHAEFHSEAGRILEMAVNGKKAEAENEIKPSSKFATLSSSLTATMMEWKKTLQ